MKNFIEKCRTLIEHKFNKGTYGQWTNSDYELLSTHISEEVKEYISASSLKRIFGKVSYSSEPSISTLNILARYIGFENWYQFVNKQSKDEPVEQPQVKRKNMFLILPGIFFLCVAIAGIVFYFTSASPEKYSYKLSFRVSKLTAPSNVVFEYDISEIKNKIVQIDFNDHFARDERENKKVLAPDKKTITHTYLVSGVYHPILLVNNKPLDTLTVCVYSDGWEYLIAKYTANSKEFFPVSSTSVSTKGGILTIPSSELFRYAQDTVSDFWIKYRYLKNFGFKPSKMSFELKARSISKFKNRCNELDIWIIGKKNNLVFKIFDPGCGGEFSKVQLGTKLVDGNYNDLSAFGHSLANWRKIRLDVNKGEAIISIDGKEIYKNSIEGDLGELTGFVLHSKGGAEFDYIHLDADGKELVYEDF